MSHRGRSSRWVRGPDAYRAAGGEPPLASRGMQNSQRVLLAKPRTAVASRHGRGRGGYAARAVHGNGHGWGVREAKQRTAPMARRREPGGPAAKHRALPQRYRTTGHEGGARRGGAPPSRGVRTATSTATGWDAKSHERCARRGGNGAGGDEGRKNGGSVCRKMNC